MPVDKFGRSRSNTLGGGVWQFSTGGLVHKVGDTMMGILSSGGFRITNVGAPSENGDAATKGYADQIDLDNLQLAGGTMSGGINMNGNRITGLPSTDTPEALTDAVSWAQVVKYADEQAVISNAQDVIVKEYADRKDAALNTGLRLYTDQKTAAARQYTDEKSNAAKQYADEKDAVLRNVHVQKTGDTMTGNLDMGGRRVTGLSTIPSTTQLDAASIWQVTKVVNDTMTNLNREPSAPLHVTNKLYVDAAIRFYADDKDTIIRRHADEKDIALNTALRLYTDQKALAAREYAKQYADDRITTVVEGSRETVSQLTQTVTNGLTGIRSTHILKAGDTMTGNLLMGGFRVSGLPVGASVSNTDAASIGQVSRAINGAMNRLNKVPNGALNVTNKQYVDAQVALAKRYTDTKDAALRQYVNESVTSVRNNLNTFNYTGHIPYIPATNNYTGFTVNKSSSLHIKLFPPNMAFTNDEVLAFILDRSHPNGWLQVECPTPVRIWKITLGGRQIKQWKLFGGVRVPIDGVTYTELPFSTTEINAAEGSQDFTINTNSQNKIYFFKIVEKTAGSVATTAGLHHFQIYTYLK